MAETTMTTSALDFEVTIVAKAGCPGVLDKPVWYTSFFSVSDSQNGVVIIVPVKVISSAIICYVIARAHALARINKSRVHALKIKHKQRLSNLHAVHVVDLITTLPIINDTSVVSTKTSGINGGGNRSMVDQQTHQFILIGTPVGDIAVHSCIGIVSIIISCAVSRVGCSVWIRSFTLVTSIGFILKVSIVSSWPSSIASISSETINAVSVSTVDQELFGQVIDRSGSVLDVEASFN